MIQSEDLRTDVSARPQSDPAAPLPCPTCGGTGTVTHAALALGGLTRREAQIAGLLGSGVTPSEITARLWISPETLRTHVQNILRKLGLHSRIELVRFMAARSPR